MHPRFLAGSSPDRPDPGAPPVPRNYAAFDFLRSANLDAVAVLRRCHAGTRSSQGST